MEWAEKSNAPWLVEAIPTTRNWNCRNVCQTPRDGKQVVYVIVTDGVRAVPIPKMTPDRLTRILSKR